MEKHIVTRFQEDFGLKHPIVLAPMGFVVGGELAAAVSNAGGLGVVAGAYGDPEFLKVELPKVKQLTDKPWGVGLIVFEAKKRPEILDLILSYKPHAIVLSFGDPRAFASKVKAAGVKLLVQVHTVEQALLAVEVGADAIIAQGTEAGGHHFKHSTLPLVPAVIDAVSAVSSVPVLAAGGIADGRGVAAALMLGASGVMMGTRFCLTEEAILHPNAKEMMIKSNMKDTFRTLVYDLVRHYHWPAEFRGRAIKNEFGTIWTGREEELMNAPASVYEEYAKANATSDLRLKPVWAGEVLDLLHDILPAGEVVERIIRETMEQLERSTSLIGEGIAQN